MPGQGSPAAPGPPNGGDLKNLASSLNDEPDVSVADAAYAPSTNGSGREPALKVVPDETKNSLLIMANDRDYQRVLRVIQNLDVVPSQVLIEAVIAEVTLNDDLQYGVQWQRCKIRHPHGLIHLTRDGGVGERSPASTTPSTPPTPPQR